MVICSCHTQVRPYFVVVEDQTHSFSLCGILTFYMATSAPFFIDAFFGVLLPSIPRPSLALINWHPVSIQYIVREYSGAQGPTFLCARWLPPETAACWSSALCRVRAPGSIRRVNKDQNQRSMSNCQYFPTSLSRLRHSAPPPAGLY